MALVFAADMVNLFEGGIISREQPGVSSYSDDLDEKEGTQRDGAGADSHFGITDNGSGDGTATGDEGADTASGAETLGESQAGWLRPLEYGLLAVVVSGGVATVFWWRERRKGVVRIKRWK